jgi:hypothetical protein
MVDLTYQASVEPDALPGRPNPRFPDAVSPQSTGAAVGQGIENLGQVVSNVFDKTQADARQAQNTDANNRIQGVVGDLLRNPKTGAFTLQGQNAFGLDQKYLPQYDQQTQAIVDAIPDPKVRASVAQMVASHRTDLNNQLNQHELDQHVKFGIQTAQASIGIATDAAAQGYNDAAIVRKNLDTVDYSVNDLGQRQGWSDEQITAAREQAHSGLHTAVIDRILADDHPQMALHYLDVAKSDMEPKAALAAATTIDSHIKEAQNALKADIADRYGDSVKAAAFGLPGAVTVSRGELGILYPNDAQRHWDGLQSMVQAGAQARKYDLMTPAEVNADVQNSMPTHGGPEAAFAIQGYQIRAQAAEQSLKARNVDPAQFVVDSGAGWKPIDLSNPQAAMDQLKSRANTAAQVSQQIGVPTPLLTNGESKQLGVALNNSTPAAKLQILTQLHQSMPDEGSYFKVLGQIAGHSPVTAIVGAKLQPPVPAQAPTWYDSKFAAAPADAETILAGEAILNPQGKNKGQDETGSFKGGFPMPKDEGSASLQNMFADQAKDVFRDRPDLADAHYSAFRDAYAALASQQGNLSGTADSKLVKQAFQMAVGTPVRWSSGNDVVAPPGMDPSRLRGLIQGAVQDMAKRTGAPADWENRIDGYQLRELGALGSGRYELVNGNAPLVRPDGKGPFIVDLKQQFARNRQWSSPAAAAQ